MAKHHRPPLSATHHWANRTSRWGKDEAQHTVEQPTPARKAQLLMWLDSNPARFNEAITQWRCTNGDAAIELGDEATSTVPGVDFTHYDARQLSGVNFKNILFRDALLTDEAQVKQLFAAGASIVDSHYGEEGKAITRRQPGAQEVATRNEAAALTQLARNGQNGSTRVTAVETQQPAGKSTAQEIARSQAAALSRYARNSR